MRIDQWLHAVRLTRTRPEAATALRAGNVMVNDRIAKPSTTISVGDHIVARLHGRQRVLDVTKVIRKRVGASIAVECYVDRSPPPDPRPADSAVFAVRDRGAGRPTKRDRRQIDRLRGRQ